MADAQFITDRQETLVSTHKVLRNTYMLLSMTLLFSAAMAGVAMALEVPYINGIFTIIVAIGLMFAVSKFKNSAAGIFLVFAFTGWMGFTLGPIISFYMASQGGGSIVMSAMGLTGMIFLSLSGYTLTTQKDFSYMAGFLMTGMWVVIGSMLLMFGASMFGFYISGFHLAISAAVCLLMSGFILYDTSRILHGGETNYLMATMSLYLSIYNLFVSLLHIMGIFGGDD